MLLDARPDRIDFRDRVYRPPLVSLPAQYPSTRNIGIFLRKYTEDGLIIDQGSEGACTGFGLAAVLNYLNWKSWLISARDRGKDILKDDLGAPPRRVSSWMLYNVARLYDEWEGEDYSGSSCRGAMKGWHKHGICREGQWSRDGAMPGWEKAAAQLPLGAYYRVNALSIADMQAAIHEVGAVYCSARVHRGWQFNTYASEPDVEKFDVSQTSENQADSHCLPIMNLSDNMVGGHAFAIVGYSSRGFIVQNSWGADWAKEWGAAATPIQNAVGGFALLTYEDWALNGNDAWVAALAAPMKVTTETTASTSRTSHSLLELSAQSSARAKLLMQSRADGLNNWSEQDAYDHSIVMGNDGKLVRRRVDTPDSESDLRHTVNRLFHDDMAKDVVIFVHGGLNAEKDAIRRAQVLGPWFEANQILPIFIVWRTGFLDAVANIGQDLVKEFMLDLERAERSGIFGFVDKIRTRAEKRFDDAFETAAEKVLGKAVWSQMKQNAIAACQHDEDRDLTGGMRLLAELLEQRFSELKQPPRIHLLGHSAGAIILGHFAGDLARISKIGSLGLLAPACTLQFANAYFRPLVDNGHLPDGKFYIYNLSRENERADSVGPYNKSLLYLVSRAFELPRKSTLLGLDDSWILSSEVSSDKISSPSISANLLGDDEAHRKRIYDELKDYYALSGLKKPQDGTKPEDLAQLRGLSEIFEWRTFMATSQLTYTVCHARNAIVRDEDGLKKRVPISHGALDNDITIMNGAIVNMTGALPNPITDLSDA